MVLSGMDHIGDYDLMALSGMDHIIQIWTCDEGNMEFYGSEATICLGQYCYQRSIKPILPDIIGQYLLYYMSNVYG